MRDKLGAATAATITAADTTHEKLREVRLMSDENQVVIPHTQRPSLFLEYYETMTPEAQGLYTAFNYRVKDFIKEYNLQNKKLVEVESLLTSVIYGLMAEMRLTLNMKIKKAERAKRDHIN